MYIQPAPALSVASLTCERRVAPLGIDIPCPRLAWKLTGDGENRRQSAYEIRVGFAPGAADLWDSGRIRSDDSSGVPYSGRKLTSSEKVYWQVRVWDEAGRASGWSPVSSWFTGILDKHDWRADWIGSPPTEKPTDSLLLRREFQTRAGLKQAVIHVTGLGQYELSVNGRKVGNDLLTPGWTDYRKTVLYDTYDVTPLLKTGVNAAGILLGNGMDNVHGPRYTKFINSLGPQRALAQIQLLYADGSKEILGTDNRWSASPGPITYSSVYGGEDFDFRRLPKGWDEPLFAGRWPAAQKTSGPGGELRGIAFAAPPIRAFEVLKPKKVYPVRQGVETFDLGQNASIMVRLTASGPRGSIVRIIPAELLKPDRSVDRTSCGGGDAWWQVTLDGTRVSYFPKFFLSRLSISAS